jgi:hypothetical protein
MKNQLVRNNFGSCFSVASAEFGSSNTSGLAAKHIDFEKRQSSVHPVPKLNSNGNERVFKLERKPITATFIIQDIKDVVLGFLIFEKT